MVLKENFYKITHINRNDNNFVVKVNILSEHPIYNGHFPEKAVVPGVCTLTVIKECLGEILNRPVEYSSIKECKYLAALLPDQDLNIIVDIELHDNINLRALVVNDQTHQSVLKLKATIR